MRNMRQVIKTNDNYITGEHYEQRMLKPVQQSYNRITVQLCDAASGKVLEEAVTENAITPLLESMAYGTIANTLNYGNLRGGCSNPVFDRIVLSDSDAAELSELFFVQGNVVGTCRREDTTTSASKTAKGIYNSAESYSSIDNNGYRHIHLVYDWLTYAGNGKIQSIYWTTFNSLDNKQIVGIKSITNAVSPSSDKKYIAYDRHGNAYCYADTNKPVYYKILNFLKYVNGFESIKTESSESFYSKYEVNDCYYNYSSSFTGGGSTSASLVLTINKYDFNGNLLDTWTEDLISNVPQLIEARNSSRLRGGNVSFAGYCDNDGWVGIRVYYQADYNTPYVFPSRNSTGGLDLNKSSSAEVYTMYNVLTKQWLHVPDPWDVWCTYTHWAKYPVIKKLGNKYFCTDGMYVQVLTDDVTGEQLENINGNDYNKQYIAQMHSAYPIVQTSSNSYFYALEPLTAHTRLASPITKTSLNTMKIQYDFFFKVPLTYMPPEHVWDLYN